MPRPGGLSEALAPALQYGVKPAADRGAPRRCCPETDPCEPQPI
ncbi:MAG: hypothetical protein ACFCVB_19130 [Nodosilinea sp.]